MRPLDAYHGNHHTFWPRLSSALGRHSRRGLGASMPLLDAPLPFRAPASPSSGLSDSTVAKAMEYRPSDIGVGSDGRTLPLPGTSGADRAGMGFPLSSSPDLIPASVYEVLDRIAEERR